MRIIRSWLVDIYIIISSYFRSNNGYSPELFLNNKGNKNPVIIIHGYLTTWLFISHLAEEINRKGHPVYVVAELGINKIEIEKASKIVSSIIDKNKLKDIILIGYSKGGHIGKNILLNPNYSSKIKGLVTIATPHSGTRVASYFKFIKSNEFYPEHKSIKYLNSKNDLNGKIITISSNHDSAIWHKSKGSLEGARENIYVNPYGHLGMIFDKKVVREVVSAIEKF